MKKIALGNSDFKTLIEDDRYFVDKSLLIKEILEDSAQIILIPRPRRFGKTLNLSMIRYFVERCDEDRRYLFNNLLIEKEDTMKKQGIYPTIYLTFKDEKHDKFEDFQMKLAFFVSEIYKKHYYLYESLTFQDDKNYFDKIINRASTKAELEMSLKNMSKYLYDYYGEKAIILIDEYDTPIQHSYF